MSANKGFIVLAAALVLLGVPLSAAAVELVVSAAASLSEAFQEAGATFERRNPGVEVAFNFAASGALLQQIANGAPVDVFACADRETMDKAQGKGLLAAGTRRDFTRNALVLVVPAGSTAGISTLLDLAKPGVKKIAAGDPGFVPAGRYALQALRSAKLVGALEPKLVLGANVRQVLDYVARAEVDAGFVFATDAAARGSRVAVASTVEGHDPVLYPIAVLESSARKADALRFVEFIAGPEGQALLRRHGFKTP